MSNQEREYHGAVLMHGKAPYNHDPQQKDSYLVTLSTPTGEKTVRGVDLERAMEEGNKGVGDLIRLEFSGSQPVTLQDVALRLMEKIKALFDKLGTVIPGAPNAAAPGPRPGN